jgi:hypothetical protein
MNLRKIDEKQSEQIGKPGLNPNQIEVFPEFPDEKVFFLQIYAPKQTFY